MGPDGNLSPISTLLTSGSSAPSTPINQYGTPVGLFNGQPVYAPNFAVNNNVSSTLQGSLTYVDPLILDLNGDGVQLTSYADNNVLFDIDHDQNASLEQTGWVKADTTTGQAYNMDGILVQDLNGNGKIDGINETFSQYYNGVAGTDGNDGTKPYADGFAALKSLDSNGDGQFTSEDVAFSQVDVWVDANADGVTEAGELKTLTELGITSIDLDSTNQSGMVNGGNEVRATGNFTQNGQIKDAQSIDFIANPAGSTFSIDANGVTINAEASGNAQATSAYSTTNLNGATLDAAALGVDNLYGNDGNDILIGDANANWLAGGKGADTIDGGAGDDVILFDSEDTIDGGDGNDVAQVVGDDGVTLDLAQSHIEVVVGGRGDDIFVGGGRSSVFINGGDGIDTIIGSAASDVLSGDDGNDLIDGGAGNDLIRGGRGQDQLLGGVGDDIIEGGQDDDTISGGDGNDVITGGQGDDFIDGGDGNDIVQFTGSYADYRITKIAVNGTVTYRVTDLLGRDGTDTLTNVEKLSFSDVSWVDPSLASPMPVQDILDKDSSGIAFDRTATAHIISKAQLLGNDIDYQGDTLHITALSDVQGGTAVLNANGDVVFTPDPNYKDLMGFKYSVADSANNFTQVTNPANGQTAAMKAAVYIRTGDIPSDPLVVNQWYLSEANIIPVWQNYTGKGVRIGQFEPGGSFSVGAEVLDVTHPDLKPNLDANWLASTTNDIPQTYS
ncbi:MAG TPA: cadherin-like domain-containing protein, partial [Methylophilaceae bacterium]